MKRTYEIQVCIPSGCRLVGCKTDGDIAVVAGHIAPVVQEPAHLTDFLPQLCISQNAAPLFANPYFFAHIVFIVSREFLPRNGQKRGNVGLARISCRILDGKAPAVRNGGGFLFTFSVFRALRPSGSVS